MTKCPKFGTYLLSCTHASQGLLAGMSLNDDEDDDDVDDDDEEDGGFGGASSSCSTPLAGSTDALSGMEGNLGSEVAGVAEGGLCRPSIRGERCHALASRAMGHGVCLL